MYHAHFGLERSLFGEGIAADAAVFRSAKHDRLIAHFKLALASPSAAIVLQGPAGVGKTTLTSAALRASSTRLAMAWLNGMPTNAAELLELTLVELGIDTLRTTRIERLQLWRQFQAETRATDSRLFVIAEVSEDLSPAVLHALDQLTAPDAVGNSGANLVLLGHAGLGAHLADPLLDSLRQRIRLRAELEPFTEAELQDYLRHQVACAGGSYDRLFAPGTVAALHRYSKGVARLANTLCESALDIAAIQQQKQLTAELVAKTAVSLLGLAEPAPVARPAATAPRVEPAAAIETRPAPPQAVAPPTSAAAPVAAPSAVAPVAAVPPAPVAPLAAERLREPVAAAPAAPGPAIAPPPLPAAAPPAVVPAAPAPLAAAPAPAPSAPTSARPVAAIAAAPAPIVPEATTAAAAPPPKLVEVEFDGSATDVADVALADFPVLTDAVELPSPLPIAKPTPPPAAKAAAAAAVPAPPAGPPPAKPVQRAEPAQPPPRPAAKPAAQPAAQPSPAAAPPASARIPTAPVASAKPAAPAENEDEDVLRQTQTMRAIAAAKSIDDISDADAETLFGDAELDLVSAALASAAEWPDDDDITSMPAPTPPPAAAKTASKPEAPKPAPPAEDPFDIFGLGDDAPLELMDDSTLPPASPARRTAIR